MAASKPQDYEVLVGLNYPPDNKRAEPGDIISDLPPKSIDWLVEQGIVVKASA